MKTALYATVSMIAFMTAAFIALKPKRKNEGAIVTAMVGNPENLGPDWEPANYAALAFRTRGIFLHNPHRRFIDIGISEKNEAAVSIAALSLEQLAEVNNSYNTLYFPATGDDFKEWCESIFIRFATRKALLSQLEKLGI